MASKKESLAPQCLAGSRAIAVHNNVALTTATPVAKLDFAAIFVARRYHLAVPLARVVAELARIGETFA